MGVTERKGAWLRLRETMRTPLTLEATSKCRKRHVPAIRYESGLDVSDIVSGMIFTTAVYISVAPHDETRNAGGIAETDCADWLTEEFQETL